MAVMERAAVRDVAAVPRGNPKLHPAIQALIDRKSTDKTEIQIFLTSTAPEVIEQLKKLGLEIVLQPKTAKIIIGRLAANKLAALAEMKEVRYIAPR